MESKWWFVVALIFLILFGVVALMLVKLPQNSPQGDSNNLEICNILKNSGGKESLLFFGDKESSEEYFNYLISSSPYNSNPDFFNAYYIDSYVPECEYYKGIAILCHSRELMEVASSCPSDYVVVLKDEPSNIRSSAYQNVLSLNLNSPKSVLLHEFAHAFANLADEYVPANIPKGSENCQVSCDEFLEDCFEGCSKSDYFRSINLGIMRTLSSLDYGEFNEQIILGKLSKSSSKLTGNVIAGERDCSNENYYLIQGDYDGMKIISKTLEKGCVSGNGAGGFEIILKDFNGEMIYLDEFNPELIFTDGWVEGEIDGETFESDVDFYLKVPVISSTENLEIVLDGNVLIETKLSDVGRRPCK
jgi:hypothetical protein